MPIRSQMTSIMGQIEPEHWSYLPLNLEKFAEYDFVYTVSTSINQSAPNLVRMYVTVQSRMSLIMKVI